MFRCFVVSLFLLHVFVFFCFAVAFGGAVESLLLYALVLSCLASCLAVSALVSSLLFSCLVLSCLVLSALVLSCLALLSRNDFLKEINGLLKEIRTEKNEKEQNVQKE